MENNILLTNNDFFLKDDIEGDINQAEEQYSNDNSKMSIAVSLLAIAKINIMRDIINEIFFIPSTNNKHPSFKRYNLKGV